MALLPIYKKGSLVAHAIVDDDVFEVVKKFRWTLNWKGYVYRCPSAYIKRKRGKPKRTSKAIYLHRLVVGAVGAEISVDHLFGDKLDNRRSQLQVVSLSENSRRAHAARVQAGAVGSFVSAVPLDEAGGEPPELVHPAPLPTASDPGPAALAG